jgi:hypothetical protein
MASSFSYTHLHLEQSAGKTDFYLKTDYIMNSFSFWDPNAYIFFTYVGFRV